jgi:hypothetical protein
MQKIWQRIAAAIIVLIMIVLALDAYPGLRGGAGWQWTYELPQSITAVAILAAVLVVYLVGAWLWGQRSTTMSLIWSFVGAVTITLAVVGIRGDVGYLLFTRTVSPVQTGATALAASVFAEEGTQSALQRWTAVMDEAYDANLIHFTTSPPGQPLLHQWIADVFDQPALQGVSQPVSTSLRPYQCSDLAVMSYTRGEIVSAGAGMLMPVFAALAVFPLYSAARTLGANALAVRSVALWWPLIPTIALFAPTWNTLYPALCITSFALLARALVSSPPHDLVLPLSGKTSFAWRGGWEVRISGLFLAFLGGLVLSFTTFLNFAVLPVLLLFGLFALGYWFWIARRSTPARSFAWLLGIGVAFGVGLLSIWIVFWLSTGVSPLDILRVTFSSHEELVQREAGSELAWLLLHPYDVALFVGFPVMVLAVVGVWRSLRGVMISRVSPLGVLAIAMAVTFLAVDLIGIVQGENGRILSFYAPFLLLAGLAANLPPIPQPLAPAQQVAHVTSGLSLREGSQVTPREGEQHEILNDRDEPTPLPLLIAQAVCIGGMAAVLAVVPLDLNPQPTAPRTDIATFGDGLPFIASGADFTSSAYAGDFRLKQYRYIGDPSAQAITYEIEWEGGTPTERPYQFELIARANNELDGDIESEPFRWSPQVGGYLTPCWKSGDVVRDNIVLPLPAISMPVVWDVELRAVDERTGDVMQVTPVDGEASNELMLEPVKYP